jgi:hypothetical protein
MCMRQLLDGVAQALTRLQVILGGGERNILIKVCGVFGNAIDFVFLVTPQVRRSRRRLWGPEQPSACRPSCPVSRLKMVRRPLPRSPGQRCSCSGGRPTTAEATRRKPPPPQRPTLTAPSHRNQARSSLLGRPNLEQSLRYLKYLGRAR